MKPSDDFHEIGEWLRSHKPRIAAPPELESRVLHAVRNTPHGRSRSSRPWIWWLLPPAAACLLPLLAPHRKAPEPTVGTPAAASVDTGSLLDSPRDPLLAESEALGRDVQRAGGFLIKCLPSLGGD